jgi:transposase
VGYYRADDPAGPHGWRKRETDTREVFNAIRYIDRTGCQWRQLPKDFPPHATVYKYFWEWTRYGVLDRIHQTLLERCRETCGREGDPTAAIIDTQVAKATEKGGSPLIRSVMMRARKLRALSATPSSTPGGAHLNSQTQTPSQLAQRSA